MVIYAFIPRELHASYYYRMLVPLRTMEDLKLPVEILIDDTSPNVPPERRSAGLTWADIVWLYQPTDPALRHNISIIKNMKGFRKDGVDWVPSTFVIDSDDNLFSCSPWNDAYRRLGIRWPDGKPLSPRAVIEADTMDGERQVLWRDGHDGFSVIDNFRRLEDYRSLCQNAGVMTCSTPNTEAYIKEEIGKDVRTYVNYNSIRFDDYVNVGLAPHKGVRIMWQGSASHYEDLYHIVPAIANALKKYPEAKFVYWGSLFPDILGRLPADQVEVVDWVDFKSYALRLVLTGADICIAPLRPNPFNASRSALKFYEASLLHDPAATIAQRSGSYAEEIEDGKTGLLFDTSEEFETHLCTLIENEKQRKEMAANAKDWVHENRDAFKVVPKLFEFFQQIRAEKRENCEIEDVPTEQPDVPSGEAEGSKSS